MFKNGNNGYARFNGDYFLFLLFKPTHTHTTRNRSDLNDSLFQRTSHTADPFNNGTIKKSLKTDLNSL